MVKFSVTSVLLQISRFLVFGELKEYLVTHALDFQNTSEPSNASTNVANAPREPYVVKQDNGSFVDKIIFDLNRAPDSPHLHTISPNQFCCFHCKDVLRDGEASESSFTLDSTPTYVDESPNVFNPPPQPHVYPCEIYGNNAYYGHYCTPKAPFIYPEPCYNQDFNFSQDFQNVPQQYPCCDDCGVTHDAYQCQPMNEVYYYGQNSCYDSTSIGFDQSQPQQYTVNHPIFNAYNDYLDSQVQLNSTLAKIMEHIYYLMLLVCYDDDDDEERFDSLDDNIISGLPPFSTITPNEPVLSTEERDNSLSMGDEHLDTILATKSDELIMSRFENLVPILSESEGIPNTMCDVHLVTNPTPLEAKDHFEIAINSNDAYSSSDDASLYNENIEYVEASPHDSELVSLEVAEIVIPKDEEIKDDNLREKLLKVNILIAKIKALKDNSTPSSEFLTKSSSIFPKSVLEETSTFDDSLPDLKTSSLIWKRLVVVVPLLILIYLFWIMKLSLSMTLPPADRSDFYKFTNELIPFIYPPEYDCFLFKVKLSDLKQALRGRQPMLINPISSSSPLSNLLFFFVFMDVEMITPSCGIKSQAGFENHPPMLNKENYVPWLSRLLRYAKSRPNGKLFHNSIINGPYVRRMIPEPGDPNRKVPVNETFHVQTGNELTKKELKQIEANDQAIQTILLGLPEDIYAAVDSCKTA
nr:hypothetical protein [Tanacetum cinerariifolium]